MQPLPQRICDKSITKIFLSIFYALILFVTYIDAHASQSSFTKKAYDSDIAFDYKWLNHQKEIKKLNFRIPYTAIKSSSNDFTPYTNRAANNYVYETVKRYKATPGVTLKITKNKSGGISVKANGPNKQVLENELKNISQIKEKAQSDYMKENNYTYLKNDTIIPDHVRIANAHGSKIMPLTRAISRDIQLSNKRDTINYVLSFFQSIPYDKLISRDTSSGSGFSTPMNLIANNRGDCDSKSTAIVSALTNLYPQLEMLMIYVPDHAFIGIAMQPQANDISLTIKGKSYVLAEPVGPALLPVGSISPSSLSAIKKKDYIYKEIQTTPKT